MTIAELNRELDEAIAAYKHIAKLRINRKVSRKVLLAANKRVNEAYLAIRLAKDEATSK
jgi:hypothetical protein